MEDERDSFGRWFLISGVFLAVVAVMGVVLALTGGVHRKSAVTAVTATTAASTVKVACSLPAGDQSVPASPPSTLWREVGAMQAPYSSTLGPQRTVDGVGVCFAHSPAGALVAAANFFADGSNVDQATLLRATAAPSAARALAIAQSVASERLQNSDGDSGVAGIAGYQITGYTGSSVSLSIVVQGPQGELAAVPMVWQWQNGTWLMQVPASGELSSSSLSDLTGYVAWGGVS